MILILSLPVMAPVIWPEALAWLSDTPSRQNPLGLCVAATIPIAMALIAFRWWLPYASKERWAAMLLLSLLSCWCVDLHYSNVDLGHYFKDSYLENVEWQRHLQDRVLHLDPAVVPHYYRFLPNCVVAWLQLLTGNFLSAALIYRLTVQFALLLGIYRLARHWLDQHGALLAVSFYCLAYVMSLRYYAGQLTDPLSHLSFVLGYLFLIANRPWPFLVVVVLGVLAKESILVLPVFAALWFMRTPRDCLKWSMSLLAGMAVLVSVRLIAAGEPTYEKISGVSPDHVASNIVKVWQWGRQTWQTIGALWFVAALRWNSHPLLLRRMTLFLFPCLWISSLLFSHLEEARNYIPVSVLLAVMAARVVAAPSTSSTTETSESYD